MASATNLTEGKNGRNELQTWYLSEHLVNMPLTEAEKHETRIAGSNSAQAKRM
ncbi:MAG: hypothetical protein ABSD75_31080 [Terriglobales bacterium]